MFQSTPGIEAGRSIADAKAAAKYIFVSIHARHRSRAIQGNQTLRQRSYGFQSTPGIEAGRSLIGAAAISGQIWFQSTPGIEAGRSVGYADMSRILPLFQSTPGIEAGRSPT